MSTDEQRRPSTERMPVRIKVYGGSLGLLPPGTEWRVKRTTAHVAGSGVIGEVMPEWTIIDLTPVEAGAERDRLEAAAVEAALRDVYAIDVEDVEAWVYDPEQGAKFLNWPVVAQRFIAAYRAALGDKP